VRRIERRSIEFLKIPEQADSLSMHCKKMPPSLCRDQQAGQATANGTGSSGGGLIHDYFYRVNAEMQAHCAYPAREGDISKPPVLVQNSYCKNLLL
jgi:hypothetical protein